MRSYKDFSNLSSSVNYLVGIKIAIVHDGDVSRGGLEYYKFEACTKPFKSSHVVKLCSRSLFEVESGRCSFPSRAI